MSYNANPIQAPPGGFNFAGGAGDPAPSALHPDPTSRAQEPPAVPPNTASSEGGSPKAERVSPMDIARRTVDAQKADPNATVHPDSRGAAKEADLVNSGKMPGLDKVQADNTRERQPGEEDASGDKIHHKTLLGRLTHWEHQGMNAE